MLFVQKPFCIKSSTIVFFSLRTKFFVFITKALKRCVCIRLYRMLCDAFVTSKYTELSTNIETKMLERKKKFSRCALFYCTSSSVSYKHYAGRFKMYILL